MDYPWLNVRVARHGRTSRVPNITSKAERISHVYGAGTGEETARDSMPNNPGFPTVEGNVYNSLLLSHFSNSYRVYSHCLE